MTTRKTISRVLAAFAVAGVATAATALAAGTASAAPASTVQPCTSNQFTTTLVDGGAGAGNHYGAVQFTANQGERCYLPGNLAVDLVGAHNVLVNNTAAADAPSVALVDGSSAYVPLHWTEIESYDQQQTPNAVSVVAPSDSNQHGDYLNPNITVDWNLGVVDASADNHTIDVGAVTQGLAPTV
ncbi:DUF4232 domain-containing protein [Amycolatopsis rhabdoformis]|uniref:DUF4232 domain-containing protein n=1 Tax=Amycolatopsis rhabdoformis TaxID=1448059 RepID=A0ABZ1I5Q8_9PSEU|nr:DUF4232 domain-containing protein [Amycolatopsis rhabdoformis]WSE29301.1 DUF4232 domain-containing protein [Amycolatopsis rhabdoformis]